MRPMSTTNSIHDNMLDQEKIRCRTCYEVNDDHANGRRLRLTKIEANSKLDCQAWNLRNVLSVCIYIYIYIYIWQCETGGRCVETTG